MSNATPWSVPANSFGFMGGGIDLAHMERFGDAIQTRVQMRILEPHGGELIVGQADIVETGHVLAPYLIVTLLASRCRLGRGQPAS